MSLKAGGIELCSVQIATASKTDIGKEFYVFGYGKLKFCWNKAKLAPNLHLVLTIQNTTNETIDLQTNQIIGLASTENCFNYPSSLYRKKLPPKLVLSAGVPAPTQERNTNNSLSSSLDKEIGTNTSTPSPRPSMTNSLPFGDIFKKFNVKSKETAGSKRDPRLMKFKEKQQTQTEESKEDLSPTFVDSILPIRNELKDEKPKTPETPIIKLDISKDKICKDTLQKVSKEMEKISTTSELEKESLVTITKQESLDQVSSTVKKDCPEAHKFGDVLIKNNAENNPIPSSSNKKKMLKSELQEAKCFDFLSESKPKEKSFKYLSKREELVKPKFSMKKEVKLENSQSKSHEPRKKEKKHKREKKEKFERKHHEKIVKNHSEKKQHYIQDNKSFPKYKRLQGGYKIEKLKKTDVTSSTPGIQNDEPKIESSNQEELTRLEEGVNICSLCGDNFMTSLELTQHISSPHTSPCFTCDLMFVTMESLNNHMQLVHQSPKLDTKSKRLAEIPKIKSVKVEALNEMFIIQDAAHLINIDNELLQRTTLSEKQANDKSSIRCKTCNKSFNNERKLFNHSIQIHYENWKFEDKSKNRERDLGRLKIEDSFPKGPFICSQCNESVKTWTQLSKHLWSPHTFHCDHCDLCFTRDTSLEDHINAEHDWIGLIGNDTKCSKCGEVFSRSSTLARHITIPHDHPCDLCDLMFQKRNILKKHKKLCVRKYVNNILQNCIKSIF